MVDNNGKRQKFLIPNFYNFPQEESQLLSPQYWAQAQKSENQIQGTGSTTYAREVRLYWYHLQV